MYLNQAAVTASVVVDVGVGVCSRFSTAHTSSSASTFSRSGDDGTSSISTLPRRPRLLLSSAEGVVLVLAAVAMADVTGNGMWMDGPTGRLILGAAAAVDVLADAAVTATGIGSGKLGTDAEGEKEIGIARTRLWRRGEADEAVGECLLAAAGTADGDVTDAGLTDGLTGATGDEGELGVAASTAACFLCSDCCSLFLTSSMALGCWCLCSTSSSSSSCLPSSS